MQTWIPVVVSVLTGLTAVGVAAVNRLSRRDWLAEATRQADFRDRHSAGSPIHIMMDRFMERTIEDAYAARWWDGHARGAIVWVFLPVGVLLAFVITAALMLQKWWEAATLVPPALLMLYMAGVWHDLRAGRGAARRKFSRDELLPPPAA